MSFPSHLTRVLQSLRTRQGEPSEADVSNQLIAEAVETALREFGRYKGPKRLFTTPAVLDEDLYDLPEEAVRVLEVFWPHGVTTEPNIFDVNSLLFHGGAYGYGSVADPGTDINLFENPSMFNIFYEKWKALRERFQGEWQEVQAPTGAFLQVRVMPPPKTAGDVIVLYRADVPDVDRIPKGDYETFMIAAMAEIFDIRATRCSLISSTSFGGQSFSFSPDKLAAKSKAYRKRFLTLASEATGPFT